MNTIPSSRTPEGTPNRCPVCQAVICIEPSTPPGDAPCPHCGHLLWFAGGMVLENLEFVVADAIIRDLPSGSKRTAIETLVGRLAEVGRLPRDAVAAVIAGLWKREELGSTGIGRGFAVPHVRHAAVSEVTAAIGYAPDGIDFEALDGAKVHTIILMISPASRPGEHLRALERVSRLLRNSTA